MKLITLDEVYNKYKEMTTVVNHDRTKMMSFGQYCSYISQTYKII
jgi:hypothetical protein